MPFVNVKLSKGKYDTLGGHPMTRRTCVEFDSGPDPRGLCLPGHPGQHRHHAADRPDGVAHLKSASNPLVTGRGSGSARADSE
jgi:hypothetical protein